MGPIIVVPDCLVDQQLRDLMANSELSTEFSELATLIDELVSLALKQHFSINIDGRHYSCPAEQVEQNKGKEVKCDCGVDAHNAKIAKIAIVLRTKIAQAIADAREV